MAKRAVFAAICALILCPALWAQTHLAGLEPKNARTMGAGGSFRVFAQGYETFSGNPAGFAGPASLTLGDISAWTYFKPYPSTLHRIASLAQGETDENAFASAMETMFSDNFGLGGGFSLGLGWAGKGFGLGIQLNSEALARGSFYSQSALEAQSQANALIGLAWPVQLGALRIRFGADIRAFYRLDSRGSWPFAELAKALYSGTGFVEAVSPRGLRGGYGIALDSGATLAWGPVSAGVMIRDYGYKFAMGDSTVGEVLETSTLPVFGDRLYMLEPTYTAGLSLLLGEKNPIKARLSVEADDPTDFFSILMQDPARAWDLAHAGVELDVLNFLYLRGGRNRGLLSIGFGLDLSLLELDAALFAEPWSTGEPRVGMVFQAALRI
ncbi:MAG TPA: hypothetical protein VIO60_07445 [Rectinemataceae bacterium]